MDWQRELSSSRAANGGWRRHDEGMEGAGMKLGKGDEDGIKVPKHEVFEERFGEGEEPAAADSQGAEATVINQRVKGKKQQHQRQRTEVKKARKEHEVEHKQVALNAVKDSVVQGGEAEGGRMRRCKQPVAQTALAWRAHQQCPQQQQQQLESKPLSQLPQPLARRRQRRLPRTFSVPKEELEGGLRSLTRNRGTDPILAETAIVPTTCAKGATKRSKRVAQRLANEEPAPPPLKLPKLHLVLTRKEIQEDWMKITGHKYSGKPKKSTLIQRGLGLCTALTCPSSIRYLNDPQ